jgi:hypothetical protein
MSECYNCTVCRSYPCSCGTAFRTNLNIPDDSIAWRKFDSEIARLKEEIEKRDQRIKELERALQGEK